ncbi:MAG: endo-1,4-beta-xylanase [Roseburia sp.]|nr:endo-1,4-beta-xylanase [Roseburia sp.]
MKKGFKKFLAKTVAVAMLMGTVTGIGVVPEKAVNAAQISEFKNVEFGIKYSGQVKTVESESGSAWSAEYFNVKDSAFETGDTFYVSAKISGASNFKQVAVQSNVNGWDWAGAPKKWTEAGIADGTVVSGLITATTEEEKISFKIQLDNAVAAVSSPVNIDLTDLYIMKVSKESAAAKDLPEDKQLDMGTRYTGQVDALAKNGVYEAQYFNVNNSSYSADDTYIISYKISGANGFKQVATQTNLNDWGWTDAKKSWNEEGISDGLDMSGDFVAASSGNGISFKVRLDTLKDAAEEPDGNVTLTLTDLIVVKVTNSDSIDLPASKLLSKGRSYSGTVNAAKDGNKWVAQYFNLENSAFEKGDQVKISFKVSGASAFKQLAVQSSFDNWAWDSAPKIWRNDGIADGTELSAVMTATCDEDNLSFKLWFDNPVAADFEDASVEVTVTDLTIKDIAKVDSLQEAYDGLFDVGAAVSAKMVGDVEYQNRIKGVFGTITAENEMKPDALLNQEASQAAEDGMPVLNLEYSGMSKILDFAKANDLKVRGHALVYGKQTPDWFFREGYKDEGAYVKSSVMSKRMESYISQVMNFVKENYPGVVTSWDVVNEALDDDGNLAENKWFKIMEDTYIEQAFIYANTYAESTAKLYYNDYNIENSGKVDAITSWLSTFEDKGARIDGVGIQGHLALDDSVLSDLQSAIQTLGIEGLDVQITELDVQLKDNQSLEDQADFYEELFTLFKNNSDLISNVTVWGINDGDSWKSTGCPLLFYDDLTPKPAFERVLSVVQK